MSNADVNQVQISIDSKTRKYALPVRGGALVETTYVDYKNKHIICFSSMVGCPIKCTFCASGYGNSTPRPLSIDEMLLQCIHVISQENIDDKPILFSCMGEGEPLLNYTNVVEALKILGGRYPNSKLAMSTSGIKPRLIEALGSETFPVPFKLQVSIHSTNDETRKQLIPITQPLTNIEKSLKMYKHIGNKVELNYVLIDRLNDSDEDARRLAKIAGDIPVKLNQLNPISHRDFNFTTRFEEFVKVLDQEGTIWEFYQTDGTDINAACGQLTHTIGQNNG